MLIIQLFLLFGIVYSIFSTTFAVQKRDATTRCDNNK